MGKPGQVSGQTGLQLRKSLVKLKQIGVTLITNWKII
jgi:hypothetical protein